jgi:hypothetical protein
MMTGAGSREFVPVLDPGATDRPIEQDWPSKLTFLLTSQDVAELYIYEFFISSNITESISSIFGPALARASCGALEAAAHAREQKRTE